MKKYEKEILQSQLDMEAAELKKLKAIYMQAADDCAKKIKFQTGKIDVLLNDWDDLGEKEKSILQSQIYQRKYQQALQKQISEIIDNMNNKQYATVSEYLTDCYENGFASAMYSLHKQGVPIIMPLDQKAVVKGAKLDSKVSKKLYGSYVTELKKHIRSEVSRGVATSLPYKDIARNLNMQTNIGLNKAMRIARTEGHNVQVSSSYETSQRAKEKGADVLKQWSAALDGRTRESHARVDGEIRELDEKFSNGLKYPGDSAGGAAEVVNCRCALLQRAKWALDEDELETLKERAAFYGLDKSKNFEDFQKKYLKAAEEVNTMPDWFIPAKTIEEATKTANDLGIKYAIYEDLPLETANLLNEALITLPKDARPVFVGSSKMLEQYRHAKLPRSSKYFYGVSINTDGIFLGIDASKAGAVKAFWDYDTFGNMVAISSHYKTADKITKAKLVAQENYIKKHGRKWFFNVDGRATPFHEMGHAYVDKYGLPEGFEAAAERWAKESGCDMLKKSTEAWAEAWGAYYTKNPDLPGYISKYVEAVAVKKTAKTGKNILPLFDDDGIISEKIKQFKKDFQEGKISTKISFQKQAKHTIGRKEYEQYKEKLFGKTGKYPSYVREDLTNKDLERLVIPKLQGNVQVNSNNEYREYVRCDEVIGYYYDKAKGEYVATRVVQIKYALGSNNIHIIPVKELQGGD